MAIASIILEFIWTYQKRAATGSSPVLRALKAMIGWLMFAGTTSCVDGFMLIRIRLFLAPGHACFSVQRGAVLSLPNLVIWALRSILLRLKEGARTDPAGLQERILERSFVRMPLARGAILKEQNLIERQQRAAPRAPKEQTPLRLACFIQPGYR